MTLDVWPDNYNKRLGASYAINIPMAFPSGPRITSLYVFFSFFQVAQLSFAIVD